jgi:hypothetical protein
VSKKSGCSIKDARYCVETKRQKSYCQQATYRSKDDGKLSSERSRLRNEYLKKFDRPRKDEYIGNMCKFFSQLI